MKYHVYTRYPDSITTVIDTDDPTKAARAYYGIMVSSANARMAVGGKELRIFEADALAYKTMRKIKKGATVAQIHRDVLKERAQ